MRAARDADVPAIEQLVDQAFAVYADRMPVPPAPTVADYATLVSAMGVRVAETDAAVVGMLVLWPHPDHVLVETVAVAPAEQGRGIGALLMATAEREAAAAGLAELRLYTNAVMGENLAWYARHGWVETGRGREHGFDRVHFSKRVARR